MKSIFKEDENKISKVTKILQKLNWAWNNPFVLSTICDLINENENIWSENIIEIYEVIIRLWLKWNKDKPEKRKYDFDLFDEEDIFKKSKYLITKNCI